MDKLPDYQELEDAYQGVSDVIKKLPDNDWTGRAIDNLKISERAAHQSRERAGIDERSAEPVTADASAEMISSGPAMAGWPWKEKDLCTD